MKTTSIYSVLALATLAAAEKPYSQDFNDNHNVLKYTAQQGPFSQRRGVGLNRDPPTGCRVDQVAMIRRHGERYPSPSKSESYAKTLEKVFEERGNLKGSLEFANYWQPFSDGKTAKNGQETQFGDYAGLHSSYINGLEYRVRYGSLYEGSEVLPIFAAGYQRIIDTARVFGQGFLGYNYTDLAALQIIPETDDQGGNSLTPTCKEKFESTCADAKEWDYQEFHRAAKRLNRENNLNLKPKDIRNLMAVASFELSIRGNSPWVNVFTDEEWIANNYYLSSSFWCSSGPGSRGANLAGSVYLNSTRTLFNQGPKAGLPIAFSFAHDSQVAPIVGLLGFATDDEWDATKVHFSKKWDASDIVPMSARLVFERLVCGEPNEASQLSNQYPQAFVGTNTTKIAFGDSRESSFSNDTISFYEAAQEAVSDKHEPKNVYVRVVLNEAVAPLPACDSGPGKSCPLGDFNALVNNITEAYNYVDTCLEKGQPTWQEFFWNWNNSQALNMPKAHISYQAGMTDWEGNPIE